MTKEQVFNVIAQVEHPAISYSLIKLGIVTEMKLEENKVSVVFVFPFPNIPIADTLIYSIAHPIESLGFDFEYNIRIMNENEKQLFLILEAEAWKGSV